MLMVIDDLDKTSSYLENDLLNTVIARYKLQMY